MTKIIHNFANCPINVKNWRWENVNGIGMVALVEAGLHYEFNTVLVK